MRNLWSARRTDGTRLFRKETSLSQRSKAREEDLLSPVESVLVETLEIVLKVYQVDLDTDFNTFGGHPQHVFRICAKLGEAFCIYLDADDLKGSVRHIAHVLEGKIIRMVNFLSDEKIDYLWEKASHYGLVVQKDPGFRLRHPDAPLAALAPALLVMNGVRPVNDGGDEALLSKIGFHSI